MAPVARFSHPSLRVQPQVLFMLTVLSGLVSGMLRNLLLTFVPGEHANTTDQA
jgi:hypothetical protein